MQNKMSTNLSNFTDVLGDVDETFGSQVSHPLSFPSSVECFSQSINDGNQNNGTVRPPKGTGQCNELRSVQEIDLKYRDVFTNEFFNIVQSRVIEDALYSDKSMVVCAPTGSGKTVIFEMAIVQLLMEIEDRKSNDDYKIIYMAPVKALCTERLTEWYSKFTKLGLLCIEVTGDTDVDFTQLQNYRVIITTPEKWDMLTRRWRDHRGLVEIIKLFLIDEVHILNDETRGPVLEAVVSRMKTIQASAQTAHRIENLQKQYKNMNENGVIDLLDSVEGSPPRIRFVAVSATVSNPEDVAAWLGTDAKPAIYYKFGDECRPVKLRRVVEGYPCAEGTSIFKFDIILNYKLWPIIQRYHDGKPTLIFCNTRKSVLLTAETLSREITITFSADQQAKLTALASTIKNKKLQALVLAGVGCHHAGMLYEERIYIEQAFRNGDLPILITTTTLAMGVNLPAHLVIIKNTQQYVNGAYQEYSISTVLQMVGRAGRPQFDSEATAVIMTRQKDKARYQALAGGSEPLQSFLHKRLAENLNSEAALGTVGDVAQCVEWLRSTFLYVRAAKDPKRYLGLTAAAPEHLILKKIEELCVIAMNGLATAGLISMDEASCILSTEAGRLMSLYYLDLETMKHIMKIQGNETLERLVWIICESHELSDMHLRTDERRCLNALNRNNTAATIRFPLKGKITTRQMKLSCIIQAVLGCLPIPDPSLHQEAMKIIRIADRVCKCLVAYMTRPEPISQQLQYFNAIINSIILAKCVSAHLWENSPYVSKQLKGIGPTFSTLLATAGKINFMLLEESHPRDLERIMNKGAPAGNVLRKQISLLPKYQLTTTSIDEKTVSVRLVLLNQVFLSENMEHLTAGPAHKCYVVIGDSENHILLLRSFTDKDLISVYNGCINYEISRKHNFEHKIFIHCVSSSFAGVDAYCDYTFTSLAQANPCLKTTSYHFHEDINSDNKQAVKQTNVEKTLEKRKRKNSSEQIAQSKEKKKRENALAEKFKLLKESFGKKSNDLKKDLQKSHEFSKDVLNELILSDKARIKKVNNEYDPDLNFVDGNVDDFMDDDLRINSILNEIESEITSTHTMTNTPVKKINTNSKAGLCGTSNTKTKNKTSNTQSLKHRQSFTGKIENDTLKSRSNYNFLQLLEKNIDKDDEYDATEKGSGFSDTIKSHVEKYMLDSHKTHNIEDLTVRQLCAKTKYDDTNKGIHDGETNINPQLFDKVDENNKDEINLVSVIKDNILKKTNDPIIYDCVYDTSDIIRTNEKQDDNYTSNSITLKDYEIRGLEQQSCNTDEKKSNSDIDYNESLHMYNSLKISSNKENKIVENDLSVPIPDNIEILNSNDSHFKNIETNIKMYNQAEINNNKNQPSRSSVPSKDELSLTIVTKLPHILPDKHDVPNKIMDPMNIISTNGQLPLYSTNKLPMLPPQQLRSALPNEITFPVSRELEPLNKGKCTSYIDSKNTQAPMDKAATISTLNFPLQSVITFETSSNNQCEDLLKENSPLLKESFNSNSFESTITQNSIINSTSENKKLALRDNKYESRNCYYTKPSNPNTRIEYTECQHNNDLELNHNISNEYEDKYSFSAEKIDIQTKFTKDHKIQVIKRLKVDLDVRKLVSSFKSKEDFNENQHEPRLNTVSVVKNNEKNEDCNDSQSIQELCKLDNNIQLSLQNRFENDNCYSESNQRLSNENNKPYNEKTCDILLDCKFKTSSYSPERNKVGEHKENNSNSTTNPEKEKLVNIFQKYSKLIGNHKNNNAKIPNYCNSSGDIKTKRRPTKPNRPFKISDIRHLNVSLPPLQCDDHNASPDVNVEIPNLCDQNSKPCNNAINVHVNTHTVHTHHSTDEILENNAPEIYELNHYQSPTLLLQPTLQISENDFEIDHSMFNPKTLLQSLRNKDAADEIIPPPPEFGNEVDSFSYSPETYDNITCDSMAKMDYLDPIQSLVDEGSIHVNNVLEDNFHRGSDLSPFQEIETWTLSRDEEFEQDLSQSTPARPYTIMHNHRMVYEPFQGHSDQNNIDTRPGRLSAFKFNRRSILKF